MLISGGCRTQLPAIPPEPQKEGSLSSPIYNQPETQKRDAYKEILWGKLCPDAPIHKKVDRLRSGPQHKDSLSSCLTVTVGPLYIIYFIVSRLPPKPFPRAGGLYELLSTHVFLLSANPKVRLDSGHATIQCYLLWPPFLPPWKVRRPT